MASRHHRRLPASEVEKRFGQVLDEIARTGGPIIVERGGTAVAVILGVESFERLRLASDEKDRWVLAMEAFDMWADRADIGEDWLAQGRI
jgi:prevent-host-death family protein